MGGNYPSQRRVPNRSNPTPTRYVPSSTRRALPRSTFNRGLPFDPWDTPAAKRAYRKPFGGRWPKPASPFGRKPGLVYPSPLGWGRMPRVGPFGAVAAAAGLLPFLWPAPAFNPAALGFTLCFDIGGIKNMHSAGANFCNVTLAGISGQTGQPTSQPILFPGAQTGRKSYMLGSNDNPEMTRMTNRELWTRNPNVKPDFKLYPRYYFVPWYAPGLDFDPNFWLPLSPVPFSPPPHGPVWPKGRNNPWGKPRKGPKHKTFPSGQSGYGNPLPKDKPTPSITISSTGVKTAPRPHVRGRPRGHNHEGGKYKASGPFAALAAQLLKDAANVYNGITEAVDLLKAVYSAIPSDILAQMPDDLPKAKLIPFMLASIWTFRNQIDYGEAVKNILLNQIEDAMWGRYFAAVDKVNRSGTYYGGFDRELGQLNELFRELQNEGN